MPIIIQQPRLSTEFAEPTAYHSSEKFGFFTVARKVEGPRTWDQRSYRLDRLPTILQELDGQPDTYISQAAFAAPNRRIASLARISLLWVDLDIYNIERLRGIPVESIAAQLLYACDDRGIPPPSVIIDSGMGMYAKWYFESSIPARALPRWQLVQNIFCLKLKDFGADPNARDAARVLRVVGSTHSKSGRRVSVLWQNQTPTHGAGMVNGIATYSFDTLADDQLPNTRAELAEMKAERELEKQAKLSRQTSTGNSLTLISARNTSGLKPFHPSQLAWDRYNDIVKLMEIRGWGNGAPEGQRDLPIFLCAAFMAQAVIVPQLRAEIEAIAKRFAPTWSVAEVSNCVTSVMAKAQAALSGQKVEYNGREVDPRYTFKTDTLLSLLDISLEEQSQLTTIISRSEAKRRDAVRARAKRAHAGAASRTEYVTDAACRRAKALALRTAGHSWAEVGNEIGVSANAARLLARHAESKRSSPSVYM